MDTTFYKRFQLISVAAATALTALAFYFGAGLYPQWWLMWVAALPVLLLAPSLSWRESLVMALAARILGGLSMWTYYRQYLHIPLSFAVEVLLIPAIAFALAVLLFRGFFRRGQVWLAVLAFPSFTVAFEYLSALSFGTFGNIGYTQLNNLPVLQLAAVTGLWGLSFVVMLFAPAVAAIILSNGAARRRMALVLSGVLLCVVGYGVWRLRATPRAPYTLTVGLVSTEFPKNIFPSADSQKIQLLEEYAGEVRALAARGARIVVLPEMSVQVSGALSDAVDRLFEQTARDAGAQALLGVLHRTSTGTFNEARLYSQSGKIEAVYRKHHLAPVAEAGATPGSDISVLDQAVGPLGLAICRDMDYPEPARRYGKDKVGLLLVPAWDFNVDRWSHGHMALMRGVEYGYSIVRSAKEGYLTVSDDRGRVLAEASTNRNTPFTTLLATAPVRHDTTIYLMLGDWF
ncbi:MAG TPA: nitrilase-related carbon-nitrogen hydrolase, partial [Terriglobia bacterium]|nr:nitrilase-related carbon-nitrogen hydrolase [Terriglobia bacterium]